MDRTFPRPAAPPDPSSSAAGGVTAYFPTPVQRLVNRYNVEASWNGNFVGNMLDARELDDEDYRHAFFSEMEFGLGAQFTPTVRGDMIYSIGREGKSYQSGFEEAYLTFLDLPLDFQARVGKFKAAFGRANQTHPHAFPWIDLPAPLRNFFGEGLTGTGVSASHLIPNPWNAYSELIFQIFNVNSGSELGEEQARGATELVHWKNVFDLNPATTLEAGLSAAHLEQRRNGYSTAEGVDLTLKWRSPQEGLYKSLTWQNELYVLQNDSGQSGRSDFWGAYSSIEHQFARRWSGGLRVDFSQVPNQVANEYVVAPFLTFHQTERLYYRLQYNHTEHDPDHGGQASNDVRLQFNISLGKHAAHTY